MTLWVRCYFHFFFFHSTGEKNRSLGRSSKLLKAPLWVNDGAGTASRAQLLTAHLAACIIHSTIKKKQRNRGLSESFLFRKHSLGQYSAGSQGGFKSIYVAINQKCQMAYCTPDFFNWQAPNKHLIKELEDNNMKMKPWGNNMNHILRLYIFQSSKVIVLYIKATTW